MPGSPYRIFDAAPSEARSSWRSARVALTVLVCARVAGILTTLSGHVGMRVALIRFRSGELHDEFLAGEIWWTAEVARRVADLIVIGVLITLMRWLRRSRVVLSDNYISPSTTIRSPHPGRRDWSAGRRPSTGWRGRRRAVRDQRPGEAINGRDEQTRAHRPGVDACGDGSKDSAEVHRRRPAAVGHGEGARLADAGRSVRRALAGDRGAARRDAGARGEDALRAPRREVPAPVRARSASDTPASDQGVASRARPGQGGRPRAAAPAW